MVGLKKRSKQVRDCNALSLVSTCGKFLFLYLSDAVFTASF